MYNHQINENIYSNGGNTKLLSQNILIRMQITKLSEKKSYESMRKINKK
jgi:hypothetical protein